MLFFIIFAVLPTWFVETVCQKQLACMHKTVATKAALILVADFFQWRKTAGEPSFLSWLRTDKEAPRMSVSTFMPVGIPFQKTQYWRVNKKRKIKESAKWFHHEKIPLVQPVLLDVRADAYKVSMFQVGFQRSPMNFSFPQKLREQGGQKPGKMQRKNNSCTKMTQLD